MKRDLVVLVMLALLAGCSMAAPRMAADMAVMSESVVVGRDLTSGADLLQERERLIIRTAHVRIEVGKTEDAVEQAVLMTKSRDGWVQESDNDSATLRIPDASLEAFLDELEELGDLDYRRIHGEDVTSQYRDSRLRLENFQRAHDRYRELLALAANVGEALAVEKELERVVGEIEVLKGRLKYLEKQVRFATVHVRFEERVTPGPLGWVWLGVAYSLKWLWGGVWE